MEMRFSRNSSSKGSISLQKKLAETRLQSQPEHVPDLTDFMNDMFFGTSHTDRKAYNLTGGDLMDDHDEDYQGSLRRSSSSRSTQEWLQEAKRMVASSPPRCDSPSRFVGSPRFAAAQNNSQASLLDRRDPLSRSARRHRAVEGVSGEILSKSVKNSRNNSETTLDSPRAADISPASAVHKWFSNILKPSNLATPPSPSPQDHHHPRLQPDSNPSSPVLPPRQATHRRSRFQNGPPATQPQAIPPPPLSRRAFKTAPTPSPDTLLLSPPKNLIESAHRRSISSSTCSVPDKQVLSPPRNLIESAHRRSISSSTCSIDKIAPKPDGNGQSREAKGGRDLNEYLSEQRIKIGNILNEEMSAKAKIVLSGPSNSTSSMVAAICYAWLLENRIRTDKEEVDGEKSVVVPVMNMRRGRMWKQQQAAWLFHHIGVDAIALLFSDEVDLESLMMTKQLNIVVVGQDVLKINGEVGSQCTILTDNYCEEAYDLLQTPVLKNLLLAGILLDTQNLKPPIMSSMTRDAEAVQLLLVGSAPNYRNAIFDQLMQDQRDSSFVEALRHNYGMPPNESSHDSRALVEHRVSERTSTSITCDEAIVQNSDKNFDEEKSATGNKVSQKSAKPKFPAAPAKAAAAPSRGKNTFFLAKWFGFGSK